MLCNGIEFVRVDFGRRGVTGVASVGGYQELPPCLQRQCHLVLGQTGCWPIRNDSNDSVEAYLRRKSYCEDLIAHREKQRENT